MKISKPIERVLEGIQDSETDFVSLSVQETLSAQLHSVLNTPDDSADINGMLRQGIYANLSEDEWTLFKFANPCSGFEMPGVNAIAAYRRIRRDCLLEYALRIALSARVEWMQAKLNPRYDRDELWRPMLTAAAARDGLAKDRLVTLWEEREGKVNNRAYAAVCQGVQALITRDPKLLEAAVEESSKRKSTGYLQGMNLVLSAVSSGDATMFAEGLQQMLKQFKSFMMGDGGLALIDPFSHGLFELARGFRPECVAEFNTAGKLPWDTEYHEWITSSDDIAVELEKLEMPGFLKSALVKMEGMDWAPGSQRQA